MTDTMTCVDCSKQKNWADGFPSRMYAVCWQCHWDAHCIEKHPLPRSERRRIRKLARRATTNKQLASARTALAAIELASTAIEATDV